MKRTECKKKSHHNSCQRDNCITFLSKVQTADNNLTLSPLVINFIATGTLSGCRIANMTNPYDPIPNILIWGPQCPSTIHLGLYKAIKEGSRVSSVSVQYLLNLTPISTPHFKKKANHNPKFQTKFSQFCFLSQKHNTEPNKITCPWGELLFCTQSINLQLYT